MKKIYKKVFRPLIRMCGVDVVRYHGTSKVLDCPTGYEEMNIEIYDSVKHYTMTGLDSVNALVEAVKYVEKNNIDGVMVECGVWKGGSAMAMALTLKALGHEAREFFLYDTFMGMPSPTKEDVSVGGSIAQEKFSKTKISDEFSTWSYSSIEEVQKNLISTGYPKEHFRLIPGKVEKTIPENIPRAIALLRLDTDWYESTKHELLHLFPLVSPNGVIIIDDYGHWKGARKAVDEYIAENNICIFLNRIDYTGRIAIKT